MGEGDNAIAALWNGDEMVGVMSVDNFFYRRPITERQLKVLRLYASTVGHLLTLKRAEEALRLSEARFNMDLIHTYDATIEGWARAPEMRDQETEGHTWRVTKLSERLARAVNVSDSESVHLRRGALHDIGKVGIPDTILLKPGPLNDAEREIKHRHPQYAFEMLAPIAYLRLALDIPYCHHERWNGTGYPRGLVGEQIPERRVSSPP